MTPHQTFPAIKISHTKRLPAHAAIPQLAPGTPQGHAAPRQDDQTRTPTPTHSTPLKTVLKALSAFPTPDGIHLPTPDSKNGSSAGAGPATPEPAPGSKTGPLTRLYANTWHVYANRRHKTPPFTRLGAVLMAIKPIGSGLTLFADYPAAALSSPPWQLNRSGPGTPRMPLGSPRTARHARAVSSMPPAGRHKAQSQSAF